MNKEQKSFWEYGASWATTGVIHTYIRSLLKDRGISPSPDVLHTYRDKKSHYGEMLKDAWSVAPHMQEYYKQKNYGIRD